MEAYGYGLIARLLRIGSFYHPLGSGYDFAGLGTLVGDDSGTPGVEPFLII